MISNKQTTSNRKSIFRRNQRAKNSTHNNQKKISPNWTLSESILIRQPSWMMMHRLPNKISQTTWVRRKQKVNLKFNLIYKNKSPSKIFLRSKSPQRAVQLTSLQWKLKNNLNCSNNQPNRSKWQLWKNKWSLKLTSTKKFPWRSNQLFKSKSLNFSLSTLQKERPRSSKMKRSSKTNNCSKCKTFKNNFWPLCKLNNLKICQSKPNSKCQPNNLTWIHNKISIRLFPPFLTQQTNSLYYKPKLLLQSQWYSPLKKLQRRNTSHNKL